MLAVITGASSGIGKELAFQLAEENYDLVLLARREDRLLEIKKALEKLDVSIEILTLDINNLDSCKRVIDYLKDREVNLFINNAGFGLFGESINNDLNKELNMINLNIKSLHYLTKEMLKIMKIGTIVNISSMAAFLPTPLLASYAATKAYVYSYSLALSYELEKKKIPINVLTVCPGPVKTEFNLVANAEPKMKGLDVKKCANIIVKGIKKNKKVIIPGFNMKLLRFFIRFTPNRLLLKISYQIQSKK